MFSIVHVAEKEIIEEGIPVLQIQPAGGRVSCQRVTDEDGVEKSDSQSQGVVAWGFLPLYELLFYLKSHHVLGTTQCA